MIELLNNLCNLVSVNLILTIINMLAFVGLLILNINKNKGGEK